MHKQAKELNERRFVRMESIFPFEAALCRLDWDIEGFYNTVPKALEILKDRLAQTKKDNEIVANCVGHSHIDVAWLWRLKHTREKAIRSFTTVLRLMEE